ncbi:MAG: hypothetical protein SH856_10545 [Flavobacteriales bacterium]|nr:hypothetical protein [Flavobacteriales bacterium]
MRNTLLLLALICLFSCNNQQQTEKAKVDNRKIDPILESVIEKYPHYADNPRDRENATKELDKKIDSVLNQGFLNDIPLKVYKSGKNPNGEGALIQFHTDNYDSNKPELLSNRLNFDIIGFVDEELASTLIKDGTYYVYGKNLKRLNETEVFSIVTQVHNSPETEIIENTIWDVYTFNIGDIQTEIDSVKFIK